MAVVAADPRVQRVYPALVESALKVGSVAIRNRASLVANSCNGSPAADTAPPLLAHDAWVTIASTDGRRTERLADFFLAPRRTLCGPGELVVSLQLPHPQQGSASAFERMTRRRGVDLATVSVAAVVDRDGRVVVGLGAVGPVPLRNGPSEPVDVDDDAGLATAVDRLLRGRHPDRRRPRRERTTAARCCGSSRSGRCAPLPTDERRDDQPMSTCEDDRACVEVACRVNGDTAVLHVPTHRTLMDALRTGLGLTGTKTCCAEGECGACSVLVDGEAVNSCLMLAVEAEGREVVTIEGLSADGPDRPAGVVPRDRRRAVRVLHPGAGDERRVPAADQPRPDRGGDPRGPLGQPVPLRRATSASSPPSG